MNKAAFYLLLLLVLFETVLFPTVLDRLGLPWITYFSPEEYNADNQNWAAVQDMSGLFYIANTRGVLEFDGRDWRLISLGDRLAARSLAVDSNNRIFVGAFGDFGYLQADERGRLGFVSLGLGKDWEAKAIGDVLTTVILGTRVVFLSADRMFLYDGSSLTSLVPQTRFQLGFVVGDQFYIRQKDIGLFRLDAQKLVFIEGSERFRDDRVYAMFPLEAERAVLLASRDNGFLRFHPERDPARRFEPHGPLSAWNDRFREIKVGVCDRLADGAIVLGTSQDGLYVIEPDGRLRFHLNRSSGLSDDVVYYVYRDRRDNLILCHGVGLSYVETGTPFRFINAAAGIQGTGNTALLASAQAADQDPSASILLGTHQGLFAPRPRRSGTIQFDSVSGAYEVWALMENRGDILVADNTGISLFKDGALRPLLKDRLVLSLLRPSGLPDTILFGAFDGLGRLDRVDGKWQSTQISEGFSQAAFNISADSDGFLWLHTHSGDGIYRLLLDEALSRIVSVRNYTSRDGLPANGGNLVFPGQGRIFVATRRGIYRYDAKTDRFEPDPLFPELNEAAQSVNLIHEDPFGHVWVFGEFFSGVYRLFGPDQYSLQTNPFARLRYFRPGEYFEVFPNGLALMSYKDGFVAFRADTSTKHEKEPFKCSIRKFDASGIRSFWGSFADDSGLRPGVQPTDAIPRVPYSRNQIRFTFSGLFMEGSQNTEYSYWLRGFDSGWSGWSKQPLSSYTNLKEGPYEFWVKARNSYGQISAPAVYHVVIETPWYRTVLALTLFWLLGGLLLLSVLKLYNRKLLKEKQRLERLVAEKTHELKEISLSDPLTGLRNRRYIDEIIQPEIKSFVLFKKFLLENEDKRFSNAQQSVFGILLFDIDHFKQVNDQHGHEAGDRVLKQFASMLKSCVRDDDFVVRWGGEEFLVILKKAQPDYILPFAEKRRDSISRQPFVLDDESISVLHRTVSIGLIQFPVYPQAPERVSFEQALMMADLGLYYAKENGRNRAVMIRPGPLIPDADELQKVLHSLDYALKNCFLQI